MKKPQGHRFSQIYLEKGKPTSDGVRARRRMAGALFKHGQDVADDISENIERVLGVAPPMASSYQSFWTDWFAGADLRDVLYVPTLAVRAIRGNRYSNNAGPFIKEIEQIFRQEGLGYTIDDDGGVHFYQDEEFENSRRSTLAGLSGPKFSAADRAFREAYAALSGAAPDTLTAVRRIFDAVENVFKMMTGEARIGSSEITKKIKPKLAAIYDGRALDAAKLTAEALSSWVNACHNYRHAPGEPDPSPPPIELAVALLSA